MQVVSDETPLFMRWHTLYALGFNPVRSKVQPAVIDMYDDIFVKHQHQFCHLMAFALHSIKHKSRNASEHIINRSVPKSFPMPKGEPHEIYAKLKARVLAVEDEPLPHLRTRNMILLGMAGTRRFVELLQRVPAGANVLVGRVGMGPVRICKNQNIRGETGYETDYFQALAALRRRCRVESFTLNSRYVCADKTSHAVTRRSMLKDFGNQVHLIHANKYEDEPYQSTVVSCDPFTAKMLTVSKGTHMADLKLAWIANHWNHRIQTLQGEVRVKDCFEARTYDIDKGNHSIADQMKHGQQVEDHMIVSQIRARQLDNSFRSALHKGISGIRITACVVNPGPADIPKALHKGNPFAYQDIDDLLALHTTRNTVQCQRIY